jgi:hypothetical protein
MATAKNKSKRLARNFHRTFIPEKQYLGALLKYAADNGELDMQAIADATGIPTGSSSGKALPTADYCLAMHLVKVEDGRLALTFFGRAVLLEDKFFREALTQWIAHLYLCNKEDGAETWYQVFWNGKDILGDRFDQETLEKWICPMIGASDGKSLGPTFRMYSDENSFQKCGAIKDFSGGWKREKAPIDSSFAIGYAAWMIDAIERNKRAGGQITVDELEEFCGFRSITGWTLGESQQVLTMLEQKGIFSIDRHMHPWIVCSKTTSESLWKRLYEDFI